MQVESAILPIRIVLLTLWVMIFSDSHNQTILRYCPQNCFSSMRRGGIVTADILALICQKIAGSCLIWL